MGTPAFTSNVFAPQAHAPHMRVAASGFVDMGCGPFLCWTDLGRRTPAGRSAEEEVEKGARTMLSVERDDDLAIGAALLDVRQRLERLVKRKRLVDDGAELAGVVEGGEFAQLGAVGLHEQEGVAHA